MIRSLHRFSAISRDNWDNNSLIFARKIQLKIDRFEKIDVILKLVAIDKRYKINI